MPSGPSPRALLDSSALIAIIKGEASARRLIGLLEGIQANAIQLVQSTITYTEVCKVPQPSHNAATEQAHVAARFEQITELLDGPGVEIVDVTSVIALHAAGYCNEHNMKPADAIHLATAVLSGCDWLVTLDGGFKDPGSGLVLVNREIIDDPSRPCPWERPEQQALIPPTH